SSYPSPTTTTSSAATRCWMSKRARSTAWTTRVTSPSRSASPRRSSRPIKRRWACPHRQGAVDELVGAAEVVLGVERAVNGLLVERGADALVLQGHLSHVLPRAGSLLRNGLHQPVRLLLANLLGERHAERLGHAQALAVVQVG